jgi:hypothetical protein
VRGRESEGGREKDKEEERGVVGKREREREGERA